MNELGKKLSFLAKGASNFENPFDNNGPNESADTEPEEYLSEDELELEALSIDWYLKKSKEKKPKKKKTKDELYSEIADIDDLDAEHLSTSDQLMRDMEELSKYSIADSSEFFDEFLSDEFEENEELKSSLISMGRKYARDTATSAESSEIVQAFSGSEKKLKTLYDQLDKDKEAVQKDIDQMRLARSRNFKTLAELIEAKNSFINSQLSIVKEMNSIKKSQFDIKLKEQKAKEGNMEDSSALSPNTTRNLFTLGKKEMLDSLGGYEGISGARSEAEYETFFDQEASDEYIQNRYFSDTEVDPEDRDGDAFLRYENVNVEYILLVDEDNKVEEIIAENADTGDLIPDYPMPNNQEMLTFDIDSKSMTAEDDYHRKYRVRRI